MAIATDHEPVVSTADLLKKAAQHYEKASQHFHEAARKEAHGHDHTADHQILEGSAHAFHAREFVDDAVKQLVADIAARKRS